MPHVKVKSRTLAIVLYPESQQSAIDSIRKNYSYVGMLHDKDTDANGELKKAHWHFIIRFKQARWSSGLAAELGIDDHFESVKNMDGALRYLSHMDDPDKFQYDPADASYSADMSVVYRKAIDDSVCEDDRVLTIVQFIESYEYPLTYSFVLKRICEMGLYGEFRRMGVLAVRLIDEHNARLGETYDVFGNKYTV